MERTTTEQELRKQQERVRARLRAAERAIDAYEALRDVANEHQLEQELRRFEDELDANWDRRDEAKQTLAMLEAEERIRDRRQEEARERLEAKHAEVLRRNFRADNAEQIDRLRLAIADRHML